MADRGISEVTSLLDGDQTSLLEIRECLSCADVREHMDIITKSALEQRKKRLREKIEETKTKAVNSERVQRRADSCFDFVVPENGGVVTASFPGELDNNHDETTCTELPDSETLKNSDATSTRHERKRRRRPSVVAKMNKAIHRRTRGR